MATVAKSAQADVEATSILWNPRMSDLVAGEDLNIAAPCYIASADGLVYMSNATAANEAAGVDGFTPRNVKAGEPVTLFGEGTRFKYSDGNLTPGQRLYIDTVAGGLNDAATPGDAVGVAKAINTTDIRITRAD